MKRHEVFLLSHGACERKTEAQWNSKNKTSLCKMTITRRLLLCVSRRSPERRGERADARVDH